MHELDELRRSTVLVRQPPLESLVTTARRRRRRALAAVTSVAAAAVVVAAGAVLTLDDLGSTGPVDEPAPQPTGARLTPEQVVTGEASRLVTGASSLDDPNVRISLWEADCPGCRGPDRPGSTLTALALTTDGFGNATYVASPPVSVQRFPMTGETRGPRIESPTEDAFLVVDNRRPVEWLVSTDGELRRVERVATGIAPTDPRLWFRCRPAETPAAWKGVPPPFVNPATAYPWCSLDPETATAHEWPARWNGSLTLPVSGAAPWGVDDKWQPTFAWWEADGTRQRQFLADSPQDARGAVWYPPTGGPLFFVRTGSDPGLRLLAPRAGEQGLGSISRPAPPTSEGETWSILPSDQFDLLVGTPGGGLIAVATGTEVTIWRADDVTGAPFERVYAEAGGGLDTPPAGALHEPVVDGDRIHVMVPRAELVSDDDGRTWSRIATWR